MSQGDSAYSLERPATFSSSHTLLHPGSLTDSELDIDVLWKLPMVLRLALLQELQLL